MLWICFLFGLRKKQITSSQLEGLNYSEHECITERSREPGWDKPSWRKSNVAIWLLIDNTNLIARSQYNLP